MKLILVARNPLAAYFVASAARRFMTSRRLVAQQWAVDLSQHMGRILVIDPDHHPVRPLEVPDRGALAQELGVRGNREVEIGPRLGDDPLDFVAGPDWNG